MNAARSRSRITKTRTATLWTRPAESLGATFSREAETPRSRRSKLGAPLGLDQLGIQGAWRLKVFVIS